MFSVKWPGYLVVLLIILTSGCASQVGPVSPSPVPTRATSTQSWEQDWERTVAAARTEGKLVAYNAGGGGIEATLSRGFKDKFGIDIEHVSGRGAELSSKIMLEKRAGLHLGDLYLGGATNPLMEWKPAGILAPIKPLLALPEVLDNSAYYDNEVPFLDKERMYVIPYVQSVGLTIFVNSDVVKTGEIKSYAELLNPRWKEKIVLFDPTVSGTAHSWFYFTVTKLGPDYHRQLAKQNPMITRDKRLQVEWVARGKYPVGLAPSKETMGEFQQMGAPVQWVVASEGDYLTGGGSLSFFDRAPHPNAARVFVNWILSKEGLTTWSRTALMSTSRKDVATDFLPPEARRKPNLQYFSTDSEEAKEKATEATKLSKEIYGPLLK